LTHLLEKVWPMPLQEVQELFVFEEAGLLDDLDVGLGPSQHEHLVQKKALSANRVKGIGLGRLGSHRMRSLCARVCVCVYRCVQVCVFVFV
jgi:hypothetical protein